MHHIREGADIFIGKWFDSKGTKVLGKHSPNHQLICNEEGTLFSYGTHFPLAKFETLHGLPHLLVNYEPSTNTTNGHRLHLLCRVGKESVVRCYDSLGATGAIRYLDRTLAYTLINHSTGRMKKNQSFLFTTAFAPHTLLDDEDGALACYLGVKGDKIHNKKELAKVLIKYAPLGSVVRKVASLLLNKKDPTWIPERESKIDNLLKALFNKKGYKEDSPSTKFLTHFHALGAAVIAVQMCSDDGGTALKLVNGLTEEEN